MKSYRRTLGLVQAIILIGAASAWCAEAGKDEGAKLYGAKCASCHAKDGKGNAAMAKVFKVDAPALDMTAKSTQDKADADLAKTIKDGVNKMPAYKDKLTDAQITEVVAYLRTLAGAKK